MLQPSPIRRPWPSIATDKDSVGSRTTFRTQRTLRRRALGRQAIRASPNGPSLVDDFDAFRGGSPVRQPVRLGTASLLACAALALTSAPAYALQVLEQPSRAAALLPVPSLPLPEVSLPALPVPTLPVPVPTVSVTPPRVPDKPRVSVPAPPAPKVLSSKRPAPRSSGPDSGSPGATSPAQQAVAIPASSKRGENQREAAGAPIPRTAAVLAGAQMQVEAAQRVLDRVDELLLSLVHDELCRALSVILDPLPERVAGLSPEVIEQLPPEIVNVVPERVLAGASVRCSSQPSGAGSDEGNSGPLTRVLGLVHSGLVGGAALPIGLGLLALGIAFRRNGSRV